MCVADKRRKCKTLIGNLRNPETIKGYAASAISSNNAMTILVLLYVDRRLKIGYFFFKFYVGIKKAFFLV